MVERSIYIDTDLESKAMSILNSMGMDLSQAVNHYLKSIVTQSQLPIYTNAKTNKRPMRDFRGALKGKIWVSDDFDEPLEDMKEYME